MPHRIMPPSGLTSISHNVRESHATGWQLTLSTPRTSTTGDKGRPSGPLAKPESITTGTSVVLEKSNRPFKQLSAEVFLLPFLSSPRERASPADCRWADSGVLVLAGVRSVPPSAESGRDLHARAARYTPDRSRRAQLDRWP